MLSMLLPMKYESKGFLVNGHISKYRSPRCCLIYSWFENKAWCCHPLSLNSKHLSINGCLSAVKEAQAADGCSLGIAAFLGDRREITVCIRHWRETEDALIKTKLA